MEITDDGVEILCESFILNPTIKNLEIQYGFLKNLSKSINYFLLSSFFFVKTGKLTWKSAKAIANMMESNVKLEELRLCGQNIGYQGISFLAKAMQKNPLRVLSVGSILF